jgi:catechol 2,3-dioxygenase-like lactoylglutathione lyase family enzyme
MPNVHIQRLSLFGLITPDADRLSQFYEQALGFHVRATEGCSHAYFRNLTDADGGAISKTLSVGDQLVELLQFDEPGRPYPDDASASDLRFQHFAIVVSDMKAAYQKLSSVPGWSAISTDGPQRLPASSGGVTAFKLRDPDGHPLELLAFPEDKCPAHWKGRPNGAIFMGIDHSAISVADSARSIAFYEALGLRVAARSLNVGPEQQRLDAVCDVHVEVTSLAPQRAPPHLELLSYGSIARGERIALGVRDVAATRLMFEAVPISSNDKITPHALIDPDGHHVVIVPSNDVSPTISIANADLPSAAAKPESI